MSKTHEDDRKKLSLFSEDTYQLQLGYPSDKDLISTASVIKSATQHLLQVCANQALCVSVTL